MKEILGKLAERRAGLVRAIENPLFHPQKISQCLGIVEDIGQVHVLLPGQPKRAERQKGEIQQLARQVAEGIHQQIHVHMPNQVSQQIVRRMEIHRRHHGDEVANLLRIERRKAQTEGATLAYAQQVDRILPATLAQGVHAMVDIAVDIVRQAQFAIGGIRVTPIDQVDIQTGIQQTANHGTVFLQIHHIGAVDQGVDDEQRHRMRLRHPRLIAIQRQLVFLINGLPRRYAGLDLA